MLVSFVNPGLLGPHGIDVVAPLRGVGRNLQDHWLVPVVLGTRHAVAAPKMKSTWPST